MVVERNGKTDVFNCYNCGKKGNMIDLYADLMNITGKDSRDTGRLVIKDIMGKLESVAPATLPALVPYASEKHANATWTESENRASATEIDRTYRALLGMLKLDPKHEEDLLRRGFQRKQLKSYGFKSTPEPAQCKRLCRLLLEKGYRLHGVPGFYVDKKDQAWTMNIYRGNKGYFCPCIDMKGKVTGFQIRIDKPKDGIKYIWFTSSGKYRGISSGALCTFYGQRRAENVLIVDGILKAAVIHALSGQSCIGIPGVNNLKMLRAMLLSLPNVREVVDATDMDKFCDTGCDHHYKTHCKDCTGSQNGFCPLKEQKRQSLLDSCKKMSAICKGYRRIYIGWDFRVEAGRIVWNGNIKGYDDLLLRQKKQIIDGCKLEKKEDT